MAKLEKGVGSAFISSSCRAQKIADLMSQNFTFRNQAMKVGSTTMEV